MSNLSTKEQIEKSKKFLDFVKTPECSGCNNGIRMCYNFPCMGTLKEIKAIIKAGYAKSLMLDYWVGSGENEEFDKIRFNPFKEDVPYLNPAIVGLESKKAPFARHGKCTLLVDNKCSLHEQGLKPIGGKIACCKVDQVYINENGKYKHIDNRIAILHTWNTEEGRAVIEEWKKEVGFTNKESESQSHRINTTGDLLDGLLNFVNYMSHKHLETNECPPKTDISKEDEIQEIYEKPY